MQRRDQTVEQQFKEVFALLDRLFDPPVSKRRQIGFKLEENQ